MKLSLRKFIEKFFKIQTKKATVEPLILNPPQEKYYKVFMEQWNSGKPVRIIILKARQQGFSTMTEAMFTALTILQKNVRTLIVAHEENAVKNLFNMAKRYYDFLPLKLKPMRRYSNGTELVFDNPSNDSAERAENPGINSSIRVEIAKDGAGRSSTYHLAHLSELAFWKGNKQTILTGINQSIPSLAHTAVVIESTANGFELYKNIWDAAVAGENDYTPLFFAWFENPEYSMRYDGFTLTDEEQELMDRFNLTLDQLQWRRWCIKNNCNNSIDQFHQEYPATPEEAFINSGLPFFNVKKVMQRIEELKDFKPQRQGRFKYQIHGVSFCDVNWQDDETGEISIYKAPIERHPYVMGADTAGEGSDFFVAYVVDNITGEMVAKYRCPTDEVMFTRQLYCLGCFYNTALIAPEANFGTYPIRKLEEWNYPNLYVREIEDTYTGKVKKSFGFRTTSITRPLILAMFQDVILENPEIICDVGLLRECLTFQKNDVGRPEALDGEHDDCVMAYAITNYARSQQRYSLLEIPDIEFYDESEEIYGDVYD